MSDLSRRTFVASLATALPVLGASDALERGELGLPVHAALDPELLRALGEVILPTELGETGLARAVTGFQAWLQGYAPVAEVNHGYGTPEIEYLPADPAPGWAAQLEAFDLESDQRWGAKFGSLDPDRRRDIVRRHLAGERSDRLPPPHEARHVAVGLLAWFCATPEATDLCYRARIGKETCRPLAQSPAEPASLTDGP